MESSEITDEERKMYMDFIRDAMIEDCRKAVCIGLNYLAALGNSSYTEILGKLCNKDLSKQNEYKFLQKYFDEKCGYEYIKEDMKLQKFGGLYGIIRSGFVHQFLLTRNSKVYTYSENPRKCAIIYGPGAKPEIIFVAEEYFKHLKCALEVYYDELINKKNPELIKNFDDRVKDAWRLKEKKVDQKS